MCLFIAYRTRSDYVRFHSLNPIFIFLVKVVWCCCFYICLRFSLLALLKSSWLFLNVVDSFFIHCLSLSLSLCVCVLSTLCLIHSLFLFLFLFSFLRLVLFVRFQFDKQSINCKKKKKTTKEKKTRIYKHRVRTHTQHIRCFECYVQSIDLAASSTRVGRWQQMMLRRRTNSNDKSVVSLFTQTEILYSHIERCQMLCWLQCNDVMWYGMVWYDDGFEWKKKLWSFRLFARLYIHIMWTHCAPFIFFSFAHTMVFISTCLGMCMIYSKMKRGNDRLHKT